MLKRREFLKHSAMVATAASTGILTADGADVLAADANGVDAIARSPIHFVLVDEELEDSVAFANTLVNRGARAFSVQDDLGRLWFGELGQAFRSGRAIAGLTTHSELMVCSSFARQHGARIRFEGSHDCRGSDALTHSLRIGVDEPAIGASLAAVGRAWPAALALRVTALSRCEAMREDMCRTTTQRSATHPGSLYSWLIS
jgi:hypothetical protein